MSPHVRFIDRFCAKLPAGSMAALLILQLDKYNRIGTSFGRAKADSLCAKYAEQLREFLPAGSPVIRLAERHFAMLVVGDSVGAIYQIATAMLREVDPRLKVNGDKFNVTSSLGMAYFPEHARDGSDLLRRAEMALSQAKENDRGLEVYQPNATLHQRALWKFETELDQAILDRKLEVLYQPKYSLQTRSVCGAEALVRWRNDAGALMPAADFVPAAERTGAIIPITWLVFEHVGANAHCWSQVPKPFSISVNVPPQALEEGMFMSRLERLRSALVAHGVHLTLELTEEGLVRGDTACLEMLAKVREMDIGLSIDDFGKGYSSLNYLKRIPASEIKIDKEFVGTIAIDARDEHIVKTTIDLAHAFHMHVVAEGVDSAEGLQMLQSLGCESVQGHFVARPMMAEVLVDWINKDRFTAIKRALDNQARRLA